MILQIQYRKTSELKPYIGNSKLHPRSQIEEIKALIKQFGFCFPISLDKNGVIIAGHGRLIAAIELGIEEVPVIVLGHLNDAQRRALTIADNRVQMNSGFDLDILARELSELAEQDFDISGLGFTDAELDRLLQETTEFLGGSSSISTPGDGRPLPKVNDGAELEQVLPDDNAPSVPSKSKFELVMEYPNKVRLVECLDQIRKDYGFDGMEQAILEMLDFWQKNS